MAEQRFDAAAHMRKIRTRQGMQDYLDVKWRIAWLRAEHPDAQIVTEQIEADETHARFKCGISYTVFSWPSAEMAKGNPTVNRVIGTGHGSETQQDFPDFYEKAETKAIGRACAALGYGTDAAVDFDDGEPLDGAAAGKGERAERSGAPAAPTREEPWINLVLREAARTGTKIDAGMKSDQMAAAIKANKYMVGWSVAATSEEKRAAILEGLKDMPDATTAPVSASAPQEDALPDRINGPQTLQLTTLVDSGFDLAARLAAMGGIPIEELTREQAKELILAGRATVRKEPHAE